MLFLKSVYLHKLRFTKWTDEWKLLAIILPINLLQSWVTPLLNDEPYYWLYGKFLSIGYFDHPPLIGLLTKLGCTLLPGEIGVRLLVTLMGSFTFFLLYKLIKQEAGGTVNSKLLLLLLLSSVFLNLYSFLAVPDTPLLFFGVLFLYYYRKYSNKDDVWNTIALALIITLLLYAKYHGLLLIAFTVLSNFKLLTRRSFYFILIIVAVLLIPHGYWQVQHHYTTLKFHLLNRETDFQLKHIFSYIGEQLAVTGPAILLVFSLLYKPQSKFQQTLKYNVVGVFIFFLLSAFKKNVNVHWTGIAFPPMLCLAYLYINQQKRYTRPVMALLIFNLVIVVFLRLDFAFNWIRIPHFNELNPKVMLAELQRKSGGYPLVFENVYNEPSFLMFYQHRPSYAINTVAYKKTQYNYLQQLEYQFQGKTVCLVTKHPVNSQSITVSIKKGRTYVLTPIRVFASFTSVNIEAPGLKLLEAGKPTTVPLTIESNLSKADQSLFKSQHGYLTLTLINKSNREPITFKCNQPISLSGAEHASFQFTTPKQAGEYSCIFSVMTDSSLAPGFNSDMYNVSIK